MSEPENPSRRIVLQRVAIGMSVGALAGVDARIARAAELTFLKETDPEAKKVQYVEDASRVKEAVQSGSNCANCSVYTAMGDTRGTCGLFKDKLVKPAGWCNAWSGI